MTRGPDANTLLSRALAADLPEGRIADRCWTRWASATFTGARHAFTVAAAGSASFDDWLARLPEIEFDLRRHLVADIAVVAVRRLEGTTEADIEALTVER